LHSSFRFYFTFFVIYFELTISVIIPISNIPTYASILSAVFGFFSPLFSVTPLGCLFGYILGLVSGTVLGVGTGDVAILFFPYITKSEKFGVVN